MRIKRIFLWTRLSFAVLSPCLHANAHSDAHILESFTVTTQNVEVREFSGASIELKSDSNAYFIKLEPNREGKVIFSLAGIGYTSTVKFTNLLFGVKITGYCGEEKVFPTFSFDDVNRDIVTDNHMLIFQRIYGTLPVWFDEPVDSINLQFSNSHSVNLSQYLGIRDLRILAPMDVTPNPELTLCRPNQVMIALDGSSSIDRDERTLIATQLLDFSRRSGFARDSHRLFITEFGTQVFSVDEVTERKAAVHAMKQYKRDKNHRSKFTSWTNWSAVLDEAIQRKPDLLIMITDGWSNWNNQGPCSFSAQYEVLIQKSQQLKTHGTRILLVTAGIDAQQSMRTIFGNLLNGTETRELQGGDITLDTNLNDTDLITIADFSSMERINFSSLLHCEMEIMPIDIPDMPVDIVQRW